MSDVIESGALPELPVVGTKSVELNMFQWDDLLELIEYRIKNYGEQPESVELEDLQRLYLKVGGQVLC